MMNSYTKMVLPLIFGFVIIIYYYCYYYYCYYWLKAPVLGKKMTSFAALTTKVASLGRSPKPKRIREDRSSDASSTTQDPPALAPLPADQQLLMQHLEAAMERLLDERMPPINERLAAVENDVASLNDQLQQHKGKITRDVGTLSARMSVLEAQPAKVMSLEAKVDSLANGHSRRQPLKPGVSNAVAIAIVRADPNPTVSIITNWDTTDGPKRVAEIGRIAKEMGKSAKAPKVVHHGERTVIVESRSEAEARDFRSSWKSKKPSFQGKPIYIHPKLDRSTEAMLQPLRAKLREVRAQLKDPDQARHTRLDMRDLTIRSGDSVLYMLTNEGEVAKIQLADAPMPLAADSKNRSVPGMQGGQRRE